MTPAQHHAHRVAELAARTSYGRLVAKLAARSRDIAGAEDALAEAFAAALTSWPVQGVPDRPDAWLMTAAKRNLGHDRARAGTAMAAQTTLALLDEERRSRPADRFGDDRLRLMFVCAHPAIDESIRAPLMLQTVLGLDAARIAASFLVSPAAMGQKLVRAKTKIRCAGIAFLVPELDQMADRLAAVLAAIYAGYGTGWEDVLGADEKRRGLAREALWLGRLVVDLMPADSEAKGLLALMLYCEARRDARRRSDGSFVPLKEQDCRLWSREMIGEAEALLRAASRSAQPGRYQTEAAIQSVHSQARITGENLSEPLDRLYDLLVGIAPSLGALTARAAARAEGGHPGEALERLDSIADSARLYQPWWAARARVLRLAGRPAEAKEALIKATGLTGDQAVRDYLIAQARNL